MPHKFSFNNLRSIPSVMPADDKYPWLGSAKADVLCPGPIVLLLSLLVMLVLPCGVAGAGPRAGAGPPPLVTVALVTEQDVNPPSEWVGHMEAIQSVHLRARVEGFLEKVNFREGSDVQAILTKARQYLKRARTVRSGGVSATDLDNAVAEELRARAQLEQAKANLQIAQINLGYTSITAPISGRIGRTAFTRGNLVNPGSGPLARVVQVDPIRVVYSISENDFVTIKAVLNDTAKGKKHPVLLPQIKLPGGQVLKTAGRVDFVDNTVDAGTGTIAVRALFKNPGGTLLPGQYVTVLVSRSEPKSMTVVPQSAVLEDHDGRYVLVVNDQNRVDMRRVKTGPVVGINWAIKSGLAVNEKVIVEGLQKVRPGQQVKTTTADEQQGR